VKRSLKLSVLMKTVKSLVKTLRAKFVFKISKPRNSIAKIKRIRLVSQVREVVPESPSLLGINGNL
jgi:hypothetical protein